MATPTVSDDPRVQEHYAAQLALTTAAASLIERLFPMLDPSDLPGSWPDFREGAAAVTAQTAQAAGSLALDYFEDMRDAAGVRGSFVPEVRAIPDRAAAAYLDTLAEKFLAEVDAEVAIQRLEAETVAAAEYLTAQEARSTLVQAVERDPQAKGWARVVRPGACYFCRMLATRGARYRSEESANFRAHTRYDGKGGVCRCTVEPLWVGRYEPPAHVRADQQLWSEATDGLSGREAVNAFRAAVEGRTETSR